MLMIDDCRYRLRLLGISHADAHDLRWIAMTLHRWHELECGSSDNYKSYCVTRGRKVDGKFVHDDAGKPFMETHFHSESKARYYPLADRERGAQKRLAKIMASYPLLTAYVQTDPRGAALYVGEKDRMAVAYTNGVAVYK